MVLLADMTYGSLTDTPIAAAVAVGAAVCGATYLLSKSKATPEGLKPLSSAPSPKTEGFLGVLPALTAKDVHRRLTAWANELGPVYTLKAFGSTIMVVTEANIAKPLMSGPDELPKFKMAYAAANQVGSVEKQEGLFTMTHATPYYQAIRKAVAPAFSQSNLLKRFPRMREISTKLVVQLTAAIPTDGSELDIMPYVIAGFFDMSTQIGFDVKFDALEDPLGNTYLQSLRAGLREVSTRITDPFREVTQTLFWWLPSSRQVLRDFEACYKVYERIIEDMKSRGEPAEDDQSIGAGIRRVIDPRTGKPLTHKELKANVSPLLVGGFDTSTATTVWTLYHIARLPEVAQRIEQELKDAGLITQDGKPGRLPEWSDLASLQYFNAVVKESLRHSSIVGSTATIRITDKAMQIGDYWVPKGTPVWIPLSAWANAKHNFPSPDEFKPERWMEGPERTQQDWTTMTFSTGSRSCPGTNQGLAQTRTALLMLLSRLHFKLGPTISDHAKMTAAEVMALTVISGVGHPFIITPRA